MKTTKCLPRRLLGRDFNVFLAFIVGHRFAQAQIDRAGNVISDGGDASVGGPVIFFVILSFLVLHLGGEGALFKMWGVLLAGAIGVGLLRMIF